MTNLRQMVREELVNSGQDLVGLAVSYRTNGMNDFSEDLNKDDFHAFHKSYYSAFTTVDELEKAKKDLEDGVTDYLCVRIVVGKYANAIKMSRVKVEGIYGVMSQDELDVDKLPGVVSNERGLEINYMLEEQRVNVG